VFSTLFNELSGFYIEEGEEEGIEVETEGKEIWGRWRER
jgi:hypothetical protein